MSIDCLYLTQFFYTPSNLVVTVLLGLVSVLIVRYWFFCYPAYIFLLYTIYRMISVQQQSKTNASVVGPFSIYDTVPTTCIAIGIFLMNRSVTTTSSTAAGTTWTTQYWIGEGLVIAMFIYNSFSGMPVVQSLKPMMVWSVIGISSALIALWFRGNVWNYCIVIVIICRHGISNDGTNRGGNIEWKVTKGRWQGTTSSSSTAHVLWKEIQ